MLLLFFKSKISYTDCLLSAPPPPAVLRATLPVPAALPPSAPLLRRRPPFPLRRCPWSGARGPESSSSGTWGGGKSSSALWAAPPMAAVALWVPSRLRVGRRGSGRPSSGPGWGRIIVVGPWRGAGYRRWGLRRPRTAPLTTSGTPPVVVRRRMTWPVVVGVVGGPDYHHGGRGGPQSSETGRKRRANVGEFFIFHFRK